MNIKFYVAEDGCLEDFTCGTCEEGIDELVIPAKVDGQEVYSIGRLSYSFSKLKDHGVKRIKSLVI